MLYYLCLMPVEALVFSGDGGMITSSRRAKFLRRCVVERARHGAQPSKRNRELPKTSVGENG